MYNVKGNCLVTTATALLLTFFNTSLPCFANCDLTTAEALREGVRPPAIGRNLDDAVLIDSNLATIAGGSWQQNRFHSEYQGSQQSRQIVALEILRDFFKSTNPNHSATTKLTQAADSVRGNGGWAREANDLHRAIQGNRPTIGESAQFIFDIYRSGNDQGIRTEIMNALGEVPGTYSEAMSAYHALAPLARGNGIINNAEPVRANEALTNLSQRFQSGFPPRIKSGMTLGNEASYSERMLHEPIRSIRGLDTGAWHANGTLLIEFESGLRAVFKPFNTELYYGDKSPNWIAFKNEVNAFHFWDVVRKNLPGDAKNNPLVFVPDTVESVVFHEGRSLGIGSMQVFAEGFETLESVRSRNNDLFEAVMRSPQAAVARLAKNNFGDFDSFPNSRNDQGNFKNIMVETDGNGGIKWYGEGNVKIALIDNGIGRIEGPEGFAFPASDAPHEAHIPSHWKAAYKRINSGELAQFYRDRRGMHHGGINDLIGRLEFHQRRF